MTKEVLISISGLQLEIDEQEAVEVISVGDYYKKNEKHYLRYEDLAMDCEDLGINNVNKNTIKISDTQVDIMKKGASNTHMIFEKNKKNVTYYSTPFGELLIGIYTTKLDITETEEELLVKLKYALDVNASHVSDCDITIRVSSRGREE
ncbi:MAG: DUF1934 domain-containing protein [bacterium]|nr:DUF1934 domain-containing protein [bacterium]